MRLEIIFKSGSTVNVDVSEWSLTKASSDIEKLEWKTPKGKRVRRLVHVDLREVAAVVEVK